MCAWHKTKLGRVVYPHKVKRFSMRDVRRILADLIIDEQLTNGERHALASMLYPSWDDGTVRGRVDALAQIKSFLQDTLLQDVGFAVPLASWLVELMEDQLRKDFAKWVAKFKGKADDKDQAR